MLKSQDMILGVICGTIILKFSILTFAQSTYFFGKHFINLSTWDVEIM